jgi:uncharacterized protein YfaS (alpha-2-macroglobulin family)
LLTGCRSTPQPVVVKPVAPQVRPAKPVVAAPSGRPEVAFDESGEAKLTTSLGVGGVGTTAATITPLSPADTTALLARLEPLPAVDNSAAPVIRPPSAPPPRAGAITPIAFAAVTGTMIADKPVSPDAGKPPGSVALEPPQIEPTGEVSAEAEVRVRFAEPMIAVAAIGEVKAPPASLTPSVPGTWRWIDTRVAQFTPTAARLPMATSFTVTVAAGAQAVSGARLRSDITSTFSTPPPRVVSVYPWGPVRFDSPVVVQLDQMIDPVAIAKRLRLTDGRRPVAFTPIALDQAKRIWATIPSVKLDELTPSPTAVILAPKTAWPRGHAVHVTLDKGAPSLEGPRVSTESSSVDFGAAAAFTVLGVDCGDGRAPRARGAACIANSYVSVEFSNPIDPASYRSSKVQITGQPFEDHEAYGAQTTLETPVEPGGPFHISVGDGLRDIYGQPLAGNRELSFTTKRGLFEPQVDARSGLFVLDPRFEIPQWVIRTAAIAKLHVELYQVAPGDFFAFSEYERGKRKTLPGKRVYSEDHAVGPRHGATARVDLRPALAGHATGHVIAVATATPAKGAAPLADYQRTTVAWIEVSKLGLSVRLDGEHLNAWTHDLTPSSFLKPVAGVQMQIVADGRTDVPPPVTTDARGHAMYDLLPPSKHDDERSTDALLVATNGDDSVFEAIGLAEKTVRTEHALWYVTDDRFTYKPGEPLYVKGWVRWTDNGINPDLAYPRPGADLAYTLLDARSNKIATGSAAFTAQGGFDLTIALPPNVNLGTARLKLTTANQSYTYPIEIQEFRTPAYSVTLADDVEYSGSRPLIAGESISMLAEAKYYAGGGLAGSPIEWSVDLRTASYEPPGWDSYTFQPVRSRSYRFDYRTGVPLVSTTARETGTLSGASTSSLAVAINALAFHAPSLLSVDATVTDVDRGTIRASSREIVVHPAALYVGVRSKPGARNTLELVVTDIDGNLVAGVPIDVAIEGVLGSERNRDDAVIRDTHQCKVTSATTPVTCAFTRIDDQTAYTATARIADARGRTNAAQLDMPWWTFADRDLSVSPDKPSYRPGDVAKLTIASKKLPATAVVSFARNGVITQQRVELSAEPSVVELPIEASYMENVHVVVDRIAARDAKTTLPETTSVDLDIPIDISASRLTMRTRPVQPLVEPGERATFEVEVMHDDKPVKGAEVALMVVDEAVLAVSGRSHPDPLEPFYGALGDGTSETNTFAMVQDASADIAGKPGFERFELDDSRHGYLGRSGYGSGGGGMSSVRAGVPSLHGPPFVIASRKDFRATAVFSPALTTDEHGKVRLGVTMPDNLTRYRIVALATSGLRTFGKAESTIVAQRKINARTVAPRFLTQGDTFALPVIVQNLDSVPRTIDVAVRAANLDAAGPQGKRVVVPSGQRAEVRFDLATSHRGRAVIQTIAVAGTAADASNVTIPVYEPATTEAFATYGTVTDKAAFERLAIPADIFPEVGGVEAELSSTQLQNLTDAYWYLQGYPFECAEQRSSRMLATTAVADILDAFAVTGRPSKQELLDQRAYDVQRLARDQNRDGGWGYFRGMTSDDFVTMQVLAAFAAAGDRSTTVKRAIGFVDRRVNALLATKKLDNATVSLAAMGLTALAAAGVDVLPRAARLDSLARPAYPVDAKARLLALFAGKRAYKTQRARLLADLLSATHETAATATVTVAFSEGEERMLLVSGIKTDALVLDALLREQPDHSIITKLAHSVLDARVRGRWLSTQENLVVVQAMRRYFDTYEKDTPDFTGKLWLGESAYAERAFKGRTTERATAHADWAAFAPGSAHDVAIDRAGTGRLYYRLGITYAPKQVDLPALDAGMIVRRTYTAVDDPDDVVHEADGRWRIKLGARVLVKLEALNTSARDAVALVDPLPAGLEPVNTALATSERAVSDLDVDAWDHVELRDNRAEAFRMQLPAGSHRFSYTARATTPGTFIAAPAKAEEMYSPETFGRSAGTTVIVQ